MIDEFQDTSFLQYHNFYPLIKDSLAAGNDCLVVGDVTVNIQVEKLRLEPSGRGCRTGLQDLMV